MRAGVLMNVVQTVETFRDFAKRGITKPIRLAPTTKVQRRLISHTNEKARIDFARTKSRSRHRPSLVAKTREIGGLVENGSTWLIETAGSPKLHNVDRIVTRELVVCIVGDAKDSASTQAVFTHKTFEVLARAGRFSAIQRNLKLTFRQLESERRRFRRGGVRVTQLQSSLASDGAEGKRTGVPTQRIVAVLSLTLRTSWSICVL